MAVRASLVVLCMLFTLAAWLKMFDGGDWLSHERLMANVALKMNIESVVIDVPLNPLGPLIGGTPLVYNTLRFVTLLFEGFFWTALLGRRWRGLVLSVALLFHAINALWLTVTFSAVLSVYLGFVDWHGLRMRLIPRELKWFVSLPATILVVATLAAAIGAGMLWNAGGWLRGVVSLGETIDWRSIWYPVVPCALAWLGFSLASLVRGRRRRGGAPVGQTPPAGTS
jgi:hypothetical protein